MVGGFAFEKSMFNRSTQAKRQVGSIFKPLVYSVAMESNLQPMTKVLDAPLLTAPNESGMVWRPKNYEDRYYGETTLKEGVTRSRNVVTIKVAEKVGLRKIMQYVKDFGIQSELASDLSITIGSGSISLLEMVTAYSVFPNMGTRPLSPYFVTRVEDADGNVLFDLLPPEHVNVIRPNTAQIMNDILMNVVERGTGFRAKVIPRPIGAKTGTSNENRDAWFIGYMPNLVVGVWTGFDDFSINVEVGTGSQASGPTWVDFVSAIVDKVPLGIFPVAEGVVYRKVDNTDWEPTSELIFENTSFEPYSYDTNPPPPPPPVAPVDNTTEATADNATDNVTPAVPAPVVAELVAQ
jgi:penicillin-binding protein 1A